MNTAALVRKRKEAHPELYCANPRCLWYIGPGGKPCENHPVSAAAPLVLTSDQVRENITAQDALRAERAAAGLCRDCGRPTVPFAVDAQGFPPAQCWVNANHYSCGKPPFPDAADRRLPARPVGAFVVLALCSALFACSSVAEPPPACAPPASYTIVIDNVCSPTCATAHAQPSHYKGETAGSVPLDGCTIDLDDVETELVVDCAACPAGADR